jgi:hypothetical protein
MVSIPEKVRAPKKEAKSREEIIAAEPIAESGGFVIDVNFFTRLVYTGV